MGTIKVLHILFNVLFMLCGIGLIGIGTYAIIGGNVAGYTSFSNLRVLAVGVICVGAFILVISLFGCCGSSKESRCLLGFYTFILALIIIAEVTVCVYAIVHKQSVIDNLPAEWNALQQNSPETISELEQVLKCCGFDANSKPISQGPCAAKPPPNWPMCGAEISAFMHTSFNVLAIVAGVVSGVQLLGLLMSSCLICALRPRHDHDRLLHNAREAHRVPYTPVGQHHHHHVQYQHH